MEHEFDIDPESMIFKDQKVILGKEQTKTQMEHSLRLVETKDSEGNTVILITDCFDLSSKEIGDLYRQRWKIETFFKWMKQHLRLKTLFGKGQNAVYNQIWIALITYCLQTLMQKNVHFKGSLLNVQRKLRSLLFDGFNQFIRSLFRKPTQSSKGQQANHREEEFWQIKRHYIEGEVAYLYDLIYEPLF